MPTQIPVPEDRKTINRNPFDIIALPNPFDIPLIDGLPVHANAQPAVIPLAKRQLKPYVLVPKVQPVTESNKPQLLVATLTAPPTGSPPPQTASPPPQTASPRVTSVAGSARPTRMPLGTSRLPDAYRMDVDPPKDGSSDIEGELQVADTPTSSQEALGEEETSSDEGAAAMDTSDNEVVVLEGKYTPGTMDILDDADIPGSGSLHHTGTMKADRKGKRKAVESSDTAEDLQGAGINVVNPVDHVEAPSSHAPVGGPAGSGFTSGSGGAFGASGVSGSSGASGSGGATGLIGGPIGGPSTTHPGDLMGEIAGMLEEEKITTESVQGNFQQLVCFLPFLHDIYLSPYFIHSEFQLDHFTRK